MPRVFTIGGENGRDIQAVVPWTRITGSPFSATTSESSFVIPHDGILILHVSNASNLAIRISDNGTEATTDDLRVGPASTWIRIPVLKGWTVSMITSAGTVTVYAEMAKNAEV